MQHSPQWLQGLRANRSRKPPSRGVLDSQPLHGVLDLQPSREGPDSQPSREGPDSGRGAAPTKYPPVLQSPLCCKAAPHRPSASEYSRNSQGGRGSAPLEYRGCKYSDRKHCDFEFAQRRATAAWVITFAKPGSRNRIPGDPVLPVIDVHCLIRNAHEHKMCRVLRDTGGEDCCQSGERKQPGPQTLHGLHLYQKLGKGRV